MEKPIQIGIAGLGRTGWRNHALKLKDMPELFAVAAVSDPDAARMAEAEKAFGSRSHADFAGLIADPGVEVVVVASPSPLHRKQAISALEAGKHVICEKPMATSLEDADAMIAAAEASGRMLTVFHNNHFAADFQKVNEVIQSGVLGRIVQIKMRWNGFGRRWDWQTLKKFGGGSLNNTGPHPLEQALLLFGPGEPNIFCDKRRVLSLGDAEDHVKIILQGKDAPLIDLEISSAASYKSEKWTVWGSQGGLTGNTESIRWKFFNPADLPPRTVSETPPPDRSYDSEDIPWQPEQVHAWVDGVGNMPAGFYRSFHRSVRAGEPLAISAAHARRVMATIQACHDLADG